MKRISSMRRASLVALGLLAVGSSFMGCLNRPIQPIEPRDTSTIVEKLPRSNVDKIDLLLMLDNSGSMGDKQAILSAAVPELVRGLLNPNCVDENGVVVSTPKTAIEGCPKGTEREFEPVKDIHVGVVTSSLGDLGTKACASAKRRDDHGKLVTADNMGGAVKTYQDKGFLQWDPDKKLKPQGEDDLDGFGEHVKELVGGVTEQGCGYEMQLESWYRFLVDPDPYQSVNIVSHAGSSWVSAEPQGIDTELLQERNDFMRPDSLLAIVMLTDENDCSINDTGYGVMAINGGTDRGMARARSECEKDINDPCCRSCAQQVANDTCPADPACATTLTKDEDPVNLRCWNTKKRFGMDFLFPTSRYVDGLKEKNVKNRRGELVPNPIFNPSDPTASARDSSLVFLAGIVGVPWQDIARRNAQGKPDLKVGLNQDGEAVGGLMSFQEMSVKDTKSGLTTWDLILGDPENNIVPADPLMWESRGPRMGQNPLTGEPLAPTTANSPTANSGNGHEFTPNDKLDPLQFACTFPLPAPEKDDECAQLKDSPLCQKADGTHDDTMRYGAKGFPGIRELEVLKGLGEQGIVGSVCPAQMQTKDPTYGYSPAVGGIIERLKQRLANKCLPHPLTPDKKNGNSVSCLVLEAQKVTDPSVCNQCNTDARGPVEARHQSAVAEARKQGDFNCFCEIPQLLGDEGKQCQTDASPDPLYNGKPIDGWCYVDALEGGAKIVKKDCKNSTDRQEVRFVGNGHSAPGTTLFITCNQDNSVGSE
jgi:hypothetical protein